MGVMSNLALSLDELMLMEISALQAGNWKLLHKVDDGVTEWPFEVNVARVKYGVYPFSGVTSQLYWKSPHDGEVYEHDQAISDFKRRWKCKAEIE
jgi:hypothetical protein